MSCSSFEVAGMALRSPGMRGVETSDVTFLAPGFVLAELLTSMVADSGFFRDLGPQPDAD